jgi:ATP-NAD kinase N-terminal domain
MITVGIIANPASGKDIRRLVAHGSVFDNDEKVSIVRRVLLGLEAVGVERVWIMPDRFGIGLKALDGLKLVIEARLLEMPAFFNQDDSCRAAGLLAECGARCIVTLGGDGTNRAVARACGHVPLMPISTGTNNVFPMMIEATTAGLAAGLVACGKADAAVAHAPRIDIYLLPPPPPAPSGTWGEREQASPPLPLRRERGAGGEGQLPLSPAWERGSGGEGLPPDDIALVDAAIYDERFVAARAIWDGAKIKEIVLTRADPGTIGLSSIAANLLAGAYPPGHGIYLRLDNGGQPVRAPIAPGLFQTVYVAEHRLLAPGDEVVIHHGRPCVLAVDGEREIELRAGAAARLRLNPCGPRVIDPRRAIELAARAGVFLGDAG